ncbi:Protein BCAP [Camelus dromedarius]|uniref:Protein BCAP n=1 Tax=Camelus dromedarius TaxID=9838 RepID=A0A5N4DAD0_CAMDR|nr:Protein BCAP [Camelus dromedarius]KAB1268071.1 Protein BCAP [Camelus dromedarius]
MDRAGPRHGSVSFRNSAPLRIRLAFRKKFKLLSLAYSDCFQCLSACVEKLLWKPPINPFTEFMEEPANVGSHSEELVSHFKRRPEKEHLPQHASENQLSWYSQQQQGIS